MTTWSASMRGGPAVAEGLGVELEESWPEPVRERRHYALRQRYVPPT